MHQILEQQHQIQHLHMQHILPLLLLLPLATSYLSPSDFDRLAHTVPLPFYSTSTTIDHSSKGRPLCIYTLTKLKHSKLEELQLKKVILLSGYMHARQPYSVELLFALFKDLTANSHSSGEKQLQSFLSEGAFIFYPFVNIDGYDAYTDPSSNKKQLRKNMNGDQRLCPQGLAGVDINRNFPSSFGSVATSSNPCSEEYHGAAPFSEAEAKVFRDVFQKFKVIAAIDVHSYGNQWIYPYASDSTNSKIKQSRIYPLYEKVIQELRANDKKILSCIQSLNYIADGVYIDWALDQGALSLAYEVGATFSGDNSIQESITSALADFYVVFKHCQMSMRAVRQGNTLVISSSYPYPSAVSVSFGDRTQKVIVQALSSAQIDIPDNATTVSVFTEDGLPLNFSTAQVAPPQKIKSWPVLVVTIVQIWMLFLGCFCCSRCANKKKRSKKREFYEMAEASYRGELSIQS